MINRRLDVNKEEFNYTAYCMYEKCIANKLLDFPKSGLSIRDLDIISVFDQDIKIPVYNV